MPSVKAAAVYAAIATITVIELARTAARVVWTAPLPITKGLVMIAVVTTILTALAAALGAADRTRSTAWTAAVGWFGLGFLRAGEVRVGLSQSGLGTPLHWALLMLLLLGIAAWVGLRFDDRARVLFTFVPILLVTQVIALVSEVGRWNEPQPVIEAALDAGLGSPPSIWFVMLDSHPSPAVLLELHSVDLSDVTARYEALGFRVWDDARSNYSHTLAAVPSQLSGTTWTPAETDGRYAEMLAGTRGGTGLLASLRDAGMTLRMAPAAWSRSGCGALIDVCAAAPFFDDHWWFLLRSTPLPDLLPAALPNPWPEDGLRVITAMGSFADGDRHFTVVHSLASHPPIILDEGCKPEAGAVPALNRRATVTLGALDAQLRCTHDALLTRLDGIDLGRDVVIITADHGYGFGDLSAPVDTWDDAKARSRFSAFVAVSTPDGCETAFAEQLSTAQLLPLVLNCYGADLDIPEHRFIRVNHRSFGGLVSSELRWDGWSPYTP